MPAQDARTRRMPDARAAGRAFAASRTQDQHDAQMAAARAAQREKLIREIDPDGRLARTNPAELGRRVAAARSAQFSQLARRKHELQRIRQEAEEAATIAAAAVLRAYGQAGAA